MKIIGLTGSIGMGKSTTAKLLRTLRIPVHDSDEAVHRALHPAGKAFHQVLAAFPKVLDGAGTGIDRSLLGQIVFSDPSQKKKLEAILHPHARNSQEDFIARARRMGQSLVVLDIPLLYETGAEKRCDAVIVVTAPSFLQRQRVLKRPGMSEDRFRRVLKAQTPDREKRRRADFTVHSGMGRAQTLRELKKLLRTFR